MCLCDTHTHTHTHTHIYTHIHTHTHTHTYIYIHTHTHTHIYIHIYILLIFYSGEKCSAQTVRPVCCPSHGIQHQAAHPEGPRSDDVFLGRHQVVHRLAPRPGCQVATSHVLPASARQHVEKTGETRSHCCSNVSEGNVIINDALNTFYLRLYGGTHMVKDHSDSERGNPLPPHGLLFPISSKGLYASSHRQDNTYHSLYYTSSGALAGA